MQIHPQFDPVIFHIAGPFAVNWYGFTYVLAFVTAYLLATYKANRHPDWNKDIVSDLLTYGALGVILGGRIGYVIFYQFDKLLADPSFILRINEGGMSFHGGFIGVMIAMAYISRQYGKTAFQTLDFIAPTVPIGLMFGRIGNYINGELYGRVSDGGYAWLMGFPQAQYFDGKLIQAQEKMAQLATTIDGFTMLPRHPSQLYQAFGEGLMLFLLLWWFSSKPRPRYAISAMFLMGYGSARFVAEFFRQPDFDQTYRLFGFMTKGQYLSLPMILIGVAMLVYAYKKNIYDNSELKK